MGIPNYPDKLDSQPLFTGEDLVKIKIQNGEVSKRDFPSKILITFQNSAFKYLISKYKNNKITGFSCDFRTLIISKQKIGLIGNFGYGGPMVVSLMEEFRALGAKYFISVGYAGAISSNLKIGDFVLCNSSIRDEGVSYHYLKKKETTHSSDKLDSLISKQFKGQKLSLHVGSGWTIDVPFRETLAEIHYYQQKGILTVDMEAASMLAFCMYHQLHLSIIFTISDLLYENEWIPYFRDKDLVKRLNLAIDIGVKSLANTEFP